jgi:predicted alpha/beta superfamily hydrolase
MPSNADNLTNPSQTAAVLESASPVRLCKHEKFRSRFLSNERDLIVYLPPEYLEQERRRFPVFYLHDGQNLFDGTTSYIPGMDWRVDETADELITNRLVEPLIIVGIYNTGEHRLKEYTPTEDAKLGGGNANLYGRMLVEEIKPLINARYRTLDDPMHTGTGGSSLGGLASLYLGFTYPHVFGKVAALSPSVWWNKKAILRIVSEAAPKPRLKIWLDIGTRESPTAVSDTERLRDLLLNKGWTLGGDLHFCEVRGARHNEAAWAERVGPMLEYLFPAGWGQP